MKFRKTEPYLWLNKQTGYFCAVFNDEHGKWRRKSLQTKDNKEALRRFNAWRRDFFIAWGSPINSSGSNIIVEDAANEWIDHVAIRYPHSTAIQYIGTIQRFSSMYSKLLVKDISIKIVNQFIDQLFKGRLSAPTINKHRRHLRIFIGYLEEVGYIEHSIKLPKPIREKEHVKFYTKDELDLIFSVIDDLVFKDFCLLGLLSALRSGELIRLTAADIDNPPGYIHVSKLQKNRTASSIPITSSIRPIVDKYVVLNPTGQLFPYKTPDTISRKFSKYRKLAGVTKNYSFHSLRHSYGTMLVEMGSDIRTIQELMRHKSIASTLKYAKVVPSHLMAVGEQMKYTLPDDSEE